jgi:methylated-DNA-[protein]-cysteine S-methyltransferase
MTMTTLSTPLGTFELHAVARGLTHIVLPRPSRSVRGPVLEGAPTDPATERHLEEAATQLGAYVAGERRDFDLELCVTGGTEFQRTVWRTLAEIPYGETISYAELARWVGRPLAVRAVGQANGANPLPIVLPCHRVIASGGGLGGYGGGLELKRNLLELEQDSGLAGTAPVVSLTRRVTPERGGRARTG